MKLTATLTIEPVTVQTITKTDGSAMPTTLLLSQKQVTDAADLAALGFPAKVKLTFDKNVAAIESNAATWNKDLASLKTEASKLSETNPTYPKTGSLSVAMSSGIPVWATVTDSVCKNPSINVTITNKIPVTVTLPDQTEKEYDRTSYTVIPATCEQIDGNGLGVETGAVTYSYSGKAFAVGDVDEANGTVYGPSATAPTNAGQYTVTATYDNATHHGVSASKSFTISQKELGTGVEGISVKSKVDLVYNGTPQGTTAVFVEGAIEDGDTCNATISYLQDGDDATHSSTTAPTNAGYYNATVTALDNPNYKLPSGKPRAAVNIAKAPRTISGVADAIYFCPGKLTAKLTPIVDDLDNSASISYVSENTAVAAVSSAGAVSALTNGATKITVTCPSTANYEAATAEVTVYSILEPIIGATVTGDGAQDKLSYTLDGTTIKVIGVLGSDNVKVTVKHRDCSDDASLKEVTKPMITINKEGLATEFPFDVVLFDGTDGKTVIQYTIDASGVVVLPDDVVIEEGASGKVATEATVTEGKATEAAAVVGAGAKIEGGAAAAAKALITGAEEAKSNPSQVYDTNAKPLVEAKIELDITLKKYDSDRNEIVLDVHPKAVYTAKADDVDEGVKIGEAPLTNDQIKAPIKITINRPAFFGDGDVVFVRHGNEIIATVNTPAADGTPAKLSWYQSSFSEVELFKDAREGSITYNFTDGRTQKKTYTAADLDTNLPVDEKSGSNFNGWNIVVPMPSDSPDETIDGGPHKTMSDTVLTAIAAVPAVEDCTATPVFTANIIPGGPSTEKYTITATAGENGKIDPAGEVKVDEGAEKTFTITPDAGYEVKEILVDGKAVTTAATYTFKDIKADHTISVSFVDILEKFKDLEGHWALDAIRYNVEKGYMKGMTDTTFEPETEMSRAMVVTMLYRIEGEPDPDDYNSFSDVEDGMWYTNAIIWAFKNKIVDGYGGHIFAPMDTITRQQLATILYRYASYKKLDVSKTAELTKFTDAGQVASWAVDGMKWAVAEGLMTGRTETTLVPEGTAKRCEVATLLQRWLEKK